MRTIGQPIQVQISFQTLKRKAFGQPTTTRIHNEMDQPILDKPKKYSYYCTKGRHVSQCPFRQ